MNNITIQGFSPLQQDLANKIWSMDTEADIQGFVTGLPKNLKREAWVVMQMIIAAELDNVMEVRDEVRSYLSSI